MSPEPLIRNIIEFLKEKNYLVNGIQHGGKYFILNDDLYIKTLILTCVTIITHMDFQVLLKKKSTLKILKY